MSVRSLGLALLVGGLAACSPSPPPPPPDPALMCEANLQAVAAPAVFDQVIVPDCRTCHRSGGVALQDFSTVEKLSANAVGQPSAYAGSGGALKMVDPGNLANSTFWLKLLGGSPKWRGPGGESVGGPMPQGALLLGEAKLQVVKNWICTGAQP